MLFFDSTGMASFSVSTSFAIGWISGKRHRPSIWTAPLSAHESLFEKIFLLLPLLPGAFFCLFPNRRQLQELAYPFLHMAFYRCQAPLREIQLGVPLECKSNQPPELPCLDRLHGLLADALKTDPIGCSPYWPRRRYLLCTDRCRPLQ